MYSLLKSLAVFYPAAASLDEFMIALLLGLLMSCESEATGEHRYAMIKLFASNEFDWLRKRLASAARVRTKCILIYFVKGV